MYNIYICIYTHIVYRGSDYIIEYKHITACRTTVFLFIIVCLFLTLASTPWNAIMPAERITGRFSQAKRLLNVGACEVTTKRSNRSTVHQIGVQQYNVDVCI